MPMRYAHRDDVLRQVGLDPDNAADANDIERIERLEKGLADAFDQKIGHSFGNEPEPETRWVTGDGTDLLYLGYPGARSIVSVAVDGRWDGAGWVDETVLDPTAWWPWIANDCGTTTLRLTEGDWTGTVRVTAVWADQPAGGDVPDDVREAMTFLVMDEYRTRNASPAGMIGPEGLVIPTRNPWNFQLVKTAIARHRVRRQRAGV